ncbi:MAG: flavodoxin domain-containing protein [Candidatus Methanoperedenaceae archaeon]|nr:flavodoxin domain-containing protein [Candidatus Methanoperedenaceae archaeon]MDW7727200.1 flavodoxin domain-containing protein [Candidatus Methanoperedens sp.]
MVEPKILIVYASRTGNTEKLAQAIAEGARSAGGVGVELKRAGDTKPIDANADAFAFGSYSAFEYMAGELKTVFEDFYHVRDKLTGKPVLIFTTGKGGQVSVIESIDKVVGVFNPDWVKPGVAVEGMPEEADKAKAREMGRKLAEAAKKKAK